MKNLLLLIIVLAFLSPVVISAQSHSEKYNSVYDRYDFIDSNGNLIGYRKENTVYNRWDYFDKNGNLRGYYIWNDIYDRWDFTEIKSNTGSTSSKTGGKYIVHDYGKPQSTFNTDLAIQALVYKQAQYNSLTTEQKIQIAKQQQYNRQVNAVREISTGWYRKANKSHDKLKKSLKKESKKLSKLNKKPKVDLNSLKNGWYEIIEFDYEKSDKTNDVEEVYRSRYIFISDENPLYYLGRDNIFFNVTNFKKVTNEFYYTADLSISNQYSDTSITKNFFIVNDNPLKEEPNHINGTKLYFYTTTDVGGEIIIDIINKEKSLIFYLPKLDKYFKSEKPNCLTKDGLVSVILAPGEYEYFARTKTKIWTDKITISDSDGCRSINLISKQ